MSLASRFPSDRFPWRVESYNRRGEIMLETVHATEWSRDAEVDATLACDREAVIYDRRNGKRLARMRPKSWRPRPLRRRDREELNQGRFHLIVKRERRP